MKLYGYWRSGTSFRVRVALALKGATIEQIPVNLLSGEHRGEEYRKINPQGLVPTLALDDGSYLSQSPAIIEYLDEALPGPKLLPDDPLEKARARQLAAVIGCDIHPLQNLRVLKYLQGELDQDQPTAFAWAAHWIEVGFEALEELLPSADQSDGPFLMGKTPSLPDCYLLPQLYAANRFGADLSRFPRLTTIRDALMDLPEIPATLPENQPDAPKD